MPRPSRLGLLVVVLAVRPRVAAGPRCPSRFRLRDARRPPAGHVRRPRPTRSRVASAEARPVPSDTAFALLGAPYRNGGGDPRGFDCSGFVAYVFGQHGMALPRTVESQADRRAGYVSRPAPGDLVFFATAAGAPRTWALRSGRDRFIHAPSSRGVVRIELLGAPYWSRRCIEARRVLGP